MELSKSDKKAARAIIEKGLQQEFASGLQQFSDILGKWDKNAPDHRETYHQLYTSVKEFDKHIARRYDDMRGSDYLYIIVAQLNDALINDADLINLSPETKNAIKRMSSIQSELNQ